MERNYELLDLKSDWVFKRIFGKEGNEDILLDLLTSILNININKIELRNTELTKNMEKQKKSVLDIKAILDDNSIVDIEMQVKDEKNITERDLQYLTKLYSEQLETGEDYTKTKKVIVINILDFNYYNVNTYHSIAHLKFEPYEKNTYIKLYDKEDTTLTNKLEIHIIELPKFLALRNIKVTKLVEWLQLISGKRELMEMALSKKAKKIEKAYKELQYLSQDEKARAEYDEYIEAKIDEQMKINYATEKGIEQGEKKEKISIAKKMLMKNKDIGEIQELTGLTKEELEKIKDEIFSKENNKKQ